MDAADANTLSVRVTEVLIRNPQVLDTIITTSGSSASQHGLMGAIMRYLFVGKVLHLTQAAHSPETLVDIFYSELAHLLFSDEVPDGAASFNTEGLLLQ